MVVSWGTGRRDWSKNIEVATVPFTRSHQYRHFTVGAWDYTPYSFYTIEDEGTYGTIGLLMPITAIIEREANYFMFFSNVTLSGNVLMKAYFIKYNLNTAEEIVEQIKYGFNKVQFNFPKGYVLTLDDMRDGWTTAFAFLPGGYVTRFTQGGMIDVLA